MPKKLDKEHVSLEQIIIHPVCEWQMISSIEVKSGENVRMLEYLDITQWKQQE